MKPIITVKFASISPEEYQQIIDHYNNIKPSSFNVLERLDRSEGGFQIALNLERCGANDQIKQLRWNRRKLDPLHFIGFNREETMLLYRSIVHVFGESAVVLSE